MKIVEENGKFYQFDNNGNVVKAASSLEEFEEGEVVKTTPEEVLANYRDNHTRVSVDNKEGNMISKITTMYGDVYGVQFDDDTVGEYTADEIVSLESITAEYDDSVAEIKGRFTEYQNMLALTEEEIEEKSKEARLLNLKVKTVLSHEEPSYTDQEILHHIAVITDNDLLDLKETQERTQFESQEEYLSSMPKFEAKVDEVAGVALGHTGDAAWLDTLELEPRKVSDVELCNEAVATVSNLELEEMSDPEFFNMVTEYKRSSLDLTDEEYQKFRTLVKGAANERIKAIKQTKVASVEKEVEDIASFDAASLFI